MSSPELDRLLLPDGQALGDQVLIVQTAFLGDLVLTLPLVSRIKELRPECRIGVVVNAANRQFAESDPRIDSVHPWDKRGQGSGVAGMLRLARQLRGEGYELALVPHRSARSGLLVRLSGIGRSIGFQKTPAGWLCATRVARNQEEHEGQRNLALLGSQLAASANPRPLLPASAEAAEEVDHWLDELDVLDSADDALVAIAPGSVWPTKRWPAAYWSELARGLVRGGATVLVVGGPDDLTLGRSIEADLPGGIRSAAGSLSVAGSAELIRRCKLLVTGDTAPLHLGVAAGTAVLALFGPTVPGFGFAPTGESDRVIGLDLDCRPCAIHGGQQCPLGHHNCMQQLTPEMVLRSALSMLA